MSAAVGLSVVLATRNGADVLRSTLDAYAAAHPPDCRWELVVVDNGSTDQTVDILETFAGRLPLRILSEPRPGKNRALNVGVAVVSGRLVIFTDDDAPPRPDFLVQWLACDAAHGDDSLFGGRVSPRFMQPPEPWLTELTQQFDVLYAATDCQDGPIRGDKIFGPNMAVRRAVFDKGHRFDESIGPDGSKLYYTMGGEMEFAERLCREGYRARFVSGAHVDHLVRSYQVTREYVGRRAYRHGRGIALRQLRQERDQPGRLGGVERRLSRPLKLAAFRILDGVRRRDDPSAFWQANWRRGYMDQLVGLPSPRV